MLTEHMFDILPPEAATLTDLEEWDAFDVESMPARECDAFDRDPGRPEPIPPGLDEWDPGLFSAAVLSSLDRSRVSGHDLVALLIAEEHLIAYFQALQAATMAELARADVSDPDSCARGEIAWEEAASEIGAALRLTRRGAEARLYTAVQLWVDYPAVGRALARGDFDYYRARVICEGVSCLDQERATEVVDRVLERASRLTSGQLRAWIRRLVAEADPDGAAERYERTVQERRIVATEDDIGIASLSGVDLPSDRVAEARARIEAIARSLCGPGETRTLDQLRADVYLDLLCGTGPDDRARGVVDIHIDLETLAGLIDNPAEIPGFGPVLADVGRRLALEHGRQWQVTVTYQGAPVWTGVTRRRPDTALARRIRARYRRCVFPGCRMPARSCDLDHTQPWCEGGATCEHNLAPLCRHHHMLRHSTWTYRRLDDGRHQWTSPLGWTYTTEHPP